MILVPDAALAGSASSFIRIQRCRFQREHWIRASTSGGRRSLAYEAPSPEVLQALTVVVRHVTVAVGSTGGSAAPGGAAPAQVRRRPARAARRSCVA